MKQTTEHSRLYQSLVGFKGAQGNEELLKGQFENIARAAFYSGHFVVNKGEADEYKIEITCIEFYYHEDKGFIQDKKKYLKGEKEFGYPISAICPNPSGIDVLFDNVDKKFHASFLIRGYKATDKNGNFYENNEKSKTWNSQDVWYDLFGGANMLNHGRFSVEWEDHGNAYEGAFEINTMERINIADGRKWGYVKGKIPC